MSLKSLIASDIDDVFINTDDFCDEHIIEGEKINCSIDNDEMSSLSGGEEFGVGESVLRIFAKTEDLSDAGLSYEGYGSHINVDGQIYTVTDWHENMGMTEIQMIVPVPS
ncbi:MAG: hypothetical protein E7279_07955 [Lachnospiraceae bacterium]|nr:hypothetical protein [Lachnospiraceae bacterium]